MYKLYGFIFGFLYLIQACVCSGFIEMRILSYKNQLNKDAKGHCCGVEDVLSLNDKNNQLSKSICDLNCTPFFRVCLKQYQTKIDTDDPGCYYGNKVTKIIKKSENFSPSDISVMKFPFQYAWKGDLTVIVEAWHSSTQDGTNTDVMNGPKQLLIQLAQSKNLTPSPTWSSETVRSNYSQLEIKYRVLCEENWYGEQCNLFCKPKDTTFAHFRCDSNGNKVCLEGWTGKNCDTAVCLPGCHPGQGQCTKPNTCECRLGYTGKLCDECVKYPGCQHGSCSIPFECTCEEGWGGLFCNQDLNFCTHHQPCKNGATCTNTGAGHYTCECKKGYTGTNCEIKMETCDQNPCLNDAVCVQSHKNYTCQCKDGYSGKHCQTKARNCTDNPCENGASCLNISNGYMCHCANGWEGTNCDMEIDWCQSSPCNNGGSCVTRFGGFDCNCPTGYIGHTCKVDKNDCRSDSCLNGGECKDQVDNFQCNCRPGYTGSICQETVDECIKRPCANGGSCMSLVNDYKCVCQTGFRGKDCSIDINECDSSPCRYGGTCEDVIGDYKCHCNKCFSGKNCEKRDEHCLNWETTFKPYIDYYNSTQPPPVIGVPYSGSSSATESAPTAAAASLPLIIGVPLVGIFVIVMVALLGVIFYLLRKSKLKRPNAENNAKNNQDDVEANMQNICNDRLALAVAKQQQFKDNNKLKSLKTESDKKFSVDNDLTDFGVIKNSNLLANNEPKCYKVVAIDKIDYSSNNSRPTNNNGRHNNNLSANNVKNSKPEPAYHYHHHSHQRHPEHHHRSRDSGLYTTQDDTSKFENNSESVIYDDDDDDEIVVESCSDLSPGTCESKSIDLRELSMDSGLASPVLSQQLSPNHSINNNNINNSAIGNSNNNNSNHVTTSPSRTPISLYQMHRHSQQPSSKHLNSNSSDFQA